MKSFGECLRAARDAADLTQNELGELMGLSQSSVCAWESDDHKPIAAHYEILLDLFPSLRSAPQPEMRDMMKPGPIPAPKSGPRPKSRARVASRPSSAAVPPGDCDCAELGLRCGLCA